MAVDAQTLGAAIKYVEDALHGSGTIQGKNCTIQSIEPVSGGNKVTFAWTEDDGTVKTSTMTVMDGVSAEVDATLTKEGFAADAKATGEAINKKAAKPLTIYSTAAQDTGRYSSSMIPIFTTEYSPSDLKAHADNGGSVTIVRYDRYYTMYYADDKEAKFRANEYDATKMQTDWYYAVLDTNREVTVTQTSHKSWLETTTGGVIGKIPRILDVDGSGRPKAWEFVDITDILPVYNGEVGEV